jgi:hypothetical protein
VNSSRRKPEPRDGPNNAEPDKMPDWAGLLSDNRVLTFHLRTHHGNLAGTGAGAGNEIRKLSRLRRVRLHLKARPRIHVELPVRLQALGWEKRILSGSSPALHGQDCRAAEWQTTIRTRMQSHERVKGKSGKYRLLSTNAQSNDA